MGLRIQQFINEEGVDMGRVEGETNLADIDYKNLLARLMMDAHSTPGSARRMKA